MVGHLAHRVGPHDRGLVATPSAEDCGERRMTRRVLVTGAAGYLGSSVIESLAARAEREGDPARIVATDIRDVPAEQREPDVDYLAVDVRNPGLADVLARHRVDTVVHLAAIVTPGPASSRELEYSVDVLGTRNVLEACVAAGVRRIIVTSSGAAYGYHADNPAWLTEDSPVRGNEEFAYSHHKRLVEEMLAEYRVSHPALEQVVFRVGTILGENTHNQITALFERPRLIAIRGAASPFVFIWDRDVAGAIEHAIFGGPAGVYNVAGDGALSIQEIAARLGKRCISIPPGLLRALLAILHPLRLSRYGPEQVNFLRYRPVLDNRRLKEVFGYVPRLSSAEVFELYRKARGMGPR
jgi:UDP-glucose 4-epimerase